MFEWSYKSEDPSVHHIGPMAQDFHEAFHLNGPDDKMISSTDPSGVAIVGVKALAAQGREQDEELDRLEKTVEALKAELTKAGRRP
jgi:hypothetical protein